MDIPLANFIATLERILDWHNIDGDHGNRTARIAVAIGKRLNGGTRLNEKQINLLDYAARIHDLGRVGIDDNIIAKTGRLTASQRAAMEAHSQIGFDLLSDSSLPAEITLTVLYHHEHWDGTGYPKGLKGLDIPLFARIVCIADMWDAMTSKRPYHPIMNHAAALVEMNRCIMWFDPRLFAIFLSLLKENNGRF